MTNRLDSLESAVDTILERCGRHLVAAAPLGLGKPHRLLNALYARVAKDPACSLHLMTALSLTPPGAGSGLQRRFLEPFLQRQYGADFPTLSYARDLTRDRLPPWIRIEEFYQQSGALLGSTRAQRHYASLNYTHVARTVAERGVQVLVQKVAREPGGERLSLSCNPDLSFDLLDEVERLGRRRPLLVAEVDPALPWLDGPCAVEASFFDVVIEPPAPHSPLFALPRQPVSDADHAIGLYASTLVRDGGTIQIGIGSLADALSHALVLRHTRNDDYLTALKALDPALIEHPLVQAIGGAQPFRLGLYGASEMVNDGFRVLHQAGILRRRVVDDVAAMHRLNRDESEAADQALCDAEGRWLEGAFYLGSNDLYRWLRELPPEQARGLRMTRVSQINQLYGGSEALEREQRRDARFFNTCMMMTALGAAVSDTLDDGRVVSGVGGQYNFVAMAHALDDGRSVLMCRAIRERGARLESNLRWQYGQATIPRHLRDIAITEYGIADLRGACDEDCVIATAAIAEQRFQTKLLKAAKQAGKLAGDFEPPASWRDNCTQRLSDRLRPLRRAGVLPDYPIGSDFTAVEQRLLPALAWLRAHSEGSAARLQLALRAVLTRLPSPGPDQREALVRMGLEQPSGWAERIEARLLRLAMSQARNDTA